MGLFVTDHSQGLTLPVRLWTDAPSPAPGKEALFL
jgi:hypothetical protein